MRHLKTFENHGEKYHALTYEGEDFEDVYFSDFDELDEIMNVTKGRGLWNKNFLKRIKEMDDKGTPYIFIIDPFHADVDKSGERFLRLLHRDDENLSPVTKDEALKDYNDRLNYSNTYSEYEKKKKK